MGANDTTNLTIASDSLQAILESTFSGILVVDHDGRIITYNKRFLEMWAIPKSVLKGRKDSDAINFVLPQLAYPDEFFNKVRHLYNDFSAESYDHILFKDGKIFERFSKPHLIAGQNVGRVWSFLDITKRHQTEQVLQESEQRYRAVVEQSNDCIFLVDLKGRKIIEANKSLANLLGYSRRQLLTMTLYDFVHHPKKDVDAKIRLVVENDGSFLGERQYLKKDGTTVSVEVNINVITYQHKKVLCIVSRDITERKKAERKLKQQYDDLERANSELDKFVYSASHDLRAPLASILGLINLAKMESNGELEYLELMENRIGKLQRYIDDITNYSRNSRLPVRHENIKIKTLIEEILEDLKYLDGADKITAKLLLRSNQVIRTDKNRLKIILYNLLSNAIKYHNVLKDKPEIRVTMRSQKSKHVLQIIDNGKGIGKKHINKVFNMFYRASDESKGSGIGLYITQDAVNKINGKILVESKLKQGSTFSIEIPRK